ncbi:histidine kinase [Lewinellaceae bacterium SD302]|nr:histidine kinase [Lewinellaceae bacterium SD302]
MDRIDPVSKDRLLEFLFQIVLHGLVLIFFAVSRSHPEISAAEWAYFALYALGCLAISYFLLPRYLYRRRYLLFGMGLMLIVGIFILVEELILEPIYYPKRAGRFPGIFMSLLEILPVVTALVATKFAWDAHKAQGRVMELESAIVASELQLLRSQIDPHFLFNNLNNLYAYAIEGSPKTPQIILELSSVLRYVLYDCREKFVPLNQELLQLENYLHLNELQIEERGVVEYHNEAGNTNFVIAPLILSVFVENAFKHGQSNQSSAIRIHVHCYFEAKNRLIFECKNNFVPKSASGKLDESTSGIGLPNVRKRLELLYPNRHELTLGVVGTEFHVRLALDLKTNEVG